MEKSTRNLLIVFAVLLLGGGGYYFYITDAREKEAIRLEEERQAEAAAKLAEEEAAKKAAEEKKAEEDIDVEEKAEEPAEESTEEATDEEGTEETPETEGVGETADSEPTEEVVTEEAEAETTNEEVAEEGEATEEVVVGGAMGDIEEGAEEVEPTPEPPVAQEQAQEPSEEVGTETSQEEANAEEKQVATPEPTPGQYHLLRTANDNNLSLFVNLIDRAGLRQSIEQSSEMTLFVPTNAAFEAMPAGVLDTLSATENVQDLKDILQFHMVDSGLDRMKLVERNAEQLATRNGDTLHVSAEQDAIRIETGLVQTADIKASNGLIHIIDTVLLPTSKAHFAHAIEEKRADAVYVGNAELSPDRTIAANLEAATDTLTTLTNALKAADTLDMLAGGNYTVFAPTDDAFNALPAGTVDALMQPENRHTLLSILRYHIVPGTLSKEDLFAKDGTSLTTLHGNGLPVQVSGQSTWVGDGRIDTPDGPASNGIIHVIDAVLLP